MQFIVKVNSVYCLMRPWYISTLQDHHQGINLFLIRFISWQWSCKTETCLHIWNSLLRQYTRHTCMATCIWFYTDSTRGINHTTFGLLGCDATVRIQPNMSEGYTASYFQDESKPRKKPAETSSKLSWAWFILRHWWWRQYAALKCSFLTTWIFNSANSVTVIKIQQLKINLINL